MIIWAKSSWKQVCGGGGRYLDVIELRQESQTLMRLFSTQVPALNTCGAPTECQAMKCFTLFS